MDQEFAKELREIRRMVEFLVHWQRKLDVKTDVAARRLERLERESSQLKDEECEASLEEALTDHTKVVKLTVDKWFVDKGYGFVRAPSGEVVFIQASVVQGMGPESVEGGKGQREGKGAASETRRALTAELAAQSESKVFEVCASSRTV